jgi:hypothetical protein
VILEMQIFAEILCCCRNPTVRAKREKKTQTANGHETKAEHPESFEKKKKQLGAAFPLL